MVFLWNLHPSPCPAGWHQWHETKLRRPSSEGTGRNWLKKNRENRGKKVGKSMISMGISLVGIWWGYQWGLMGFNEVAHGVGIWWDITIQLNGIYISNFMSYLVQKDTSACFFFFFKWFTYNHTNKMAPPPVLRILNLVCKPIKTAFYPP